MSLTLTDAARAALLDALRDAGTDQVRLEISPDYRYELSMGPRESDDVVVEAQGLAILLDPASATRVEGTRIDFVTDASGAQGFRIENPREPPRVRQLAATQLHAWRQAQRPHVLVDVRTPHEWSVARIEGARLLDADFDSRLRALDRDTALVFQCHHGVRSQAAAEAFLRLGFRQVYNLVGGIEAWSSEVDPKVPHY